ncbi:MAG: hypothetical protein SNJ77_13010, partial [Cytophagales bacterium]
MTKRPYSLLYGLLLLVISLVASHSQTVYTVNSTASGQTGSGTSGTLEWVISQIAYSTPSGSYRVVFDLPAGVQTITLSSALGFYPNLNKTVEIDGSSKADFNATNCSPRVYIRSNNPTGMNGFEIGGGATSSVTIKNLGFQNLNNAIVSQSNTVSINVLGCYFGVDSDGIGVTGGDIRNSAILINTGLNLTVGGVGTCERNLITNCRGQGIELNSAMSSVNIANNYFGLGADGTTFANLFITNAGIRLNNNNLNNVTIGGATDAHRNVISNCRTRGIFSENLG